MAKVSSTAATLERITTLHTAVTKGTSDTLAKWVLTSPWFRNSNRERNAIFEQIISAVRDPGPNDTMKVTARSPIPWLREPFTHGKLPPLKLWDKIARGSHLWPAELRKSARPLKLGSGKLPTWTQIEDYYGGIGYEAVPVQGFLGLPILSRLIATRRVASSTVWVMRPRIYPYNFNPTDVIHDLGHGLAMGIRDYRELLAEFSKAVCRIGNAKALVSAEGIYYRLFERAYVLNTDGSAQPIASLSTTFDNLRVERDRIVPAQRYSIEEIRSVDRGYYFRSRKDWAKEVERVIGKI